VEQTLRIPHLKRTGVIYRPLTGSTVRQQAEQGAFDGAAAARLGAFMARLHRGGVYFRALHLGNVLSLPDRSFGLIDISDMQITPWPLFANTRMRNFIHLFHYPQDVDILTRAGLQRFMAGYLEAQQASLRMRGRLQRLFELPEEGMGV
jgi:hypothetical protein